jgi:hypothetical protein
MSTDASLQESLRRQLEGRWEHVEQARVRYDGLLQQLGAFDWRQRLRSQPERLTSVHEQEPHLTEVLDYVEHRAEREHWPANHPGLSVLRALRSQRTRLEKLARKRLAVLTSEKGASLHEVLGRLETLLREPLPEHPGSTEPMLLTEESPAGHFCLTPQRLYWKPNSGEPVQVVLASLPPGRVSSRHGWLLVEGARTVRVPAGRRARYLAALVEALRQVALEREDSPGPGALVTSKAWCHVQHRGGVVDADWGVCVLRPGYVAFLPARNRDELGSWLFNKTQRDPRALRQEELLVELLQRLPEAAFDAWVESLARAARGGCFWPAGSAELFRPWGPDASRGFRLVSQGRVLTVPTPLVPGSPADALLQRWPPYEGARHLDPSVLHRMRRHFPALVLLLFGSLLGPAIALAANDAPAWLPMFCTVLGVVGSCAYAKGKGYSPLLGLPSLLVCGWSFFLIFRKDRNTPPPLE